MAKVRAEKIKTYKDINIGLVVFLFIIIYIVINVYIYFTKSEISIYEVPSGTLYSTQTYKGLIVRSEEIFKTDMAGYVNYYYQEGDRIRKNETVYSIDSDKSIYNRLTGDTSEIKLSNEDVQNLKRYITGEYAENSRFSDYEGLKEQLLTSYRKQLDETLLQNLNKIVAETGLSSNFSVVKSEKAGILSYSIDDMPLITEDNVTPELFKSGNEVCTSLYTSELLAAGSSVYKLITEDNWKIIVHIDENLFKKLHEKKSVSFTVNGRQTITADFTSFVKDDDYYITIYLSKFITNYTKYRYLTISFDTAGSEGLKIPVTSLVYKNYYRIPVEYFVQGSDTDVFALKTESYDPDKGERTYINKDVEIFYSDGQYYYIDTNAFPSDTYIATGSENERSMLYVFITKVEGAYNVNNGYALFRRIVRITSSGDYVIIEKNSMSGLSEFDHIALDAEHVTEGAVIY